MDEPSFTLSAEQRYLVQSGVCEQAADTAKVLAVRLSRIGEGFPRAKDAKDEIDIARDHVSSLGEAVELLERLPLSEEESRARFGGV